MTKTIILSELNITNYPYQIPLGYASVTRLDTISPPGDWRKLSQLLAIAQTASLCIVRPLEENCAFLIWAVVALLLWPE